MRYRKEVSFVTQQLQSRVLSGFMILWIRQEHQRVSGDNFSLCEINCVIRELKNYWEDRRSVVTVSGSRLLWLNGGLFHNAVFTVSVSSRDWNRDTILTCDHRRVITPITVSRQVSFRGNNPCKQNCWQNSLDTSLVCLLPYRGKLN